jgi:hypothetical protein
MAEDDAKLVMSVKELRKLLKQQQEEASRPRRFHLSPHFGPDNIVEIAKSQFPRLEAKVAMHYEMERTRRMLIAVAAICLMAGAALVVFAPPGKEGVSYVVAALLGILPLGAIGVQEFRIRTIGVQIEAGEGAVQSQKDAS